jgi:hypothetical protein
MERWPPKLDEPQRNEAGRTCRADRSEAQMTGDQSRALKVGDRVCWGAKTTDLGTVIGTSWSEVTIAWDDGEANSVSHNDMAQVERVPVKV